MIMGWFAKKCALCGTKVDEEKAVKMLDKYFCTEEHAEEYRKRMAEREKNKHRHSGGCC